MNDKIKNFLIYTGLFGAIAGGIGYILIIMAIVMGFETDLSTNQQMTIAIIGASSGILINISLRYQGIAFASKEEKSKIVNERYQLLINKDKPIKSYKLIGYFMFWAIIKDIIFKGLTVGLTTYFLIYIFVEGNGDYSLFLVALANLMMFTGFGLMGLSGMYDKYIQNHIPALEGICNKLDQDGSVHPKENKDVNIQQCEVQESSATSSKE